MMTTPRATPVSIRPRGQILPMAVVMFVVAFTFGAAAIQAIPSHASGSLAEHRREELDAITRQRRARIAELRTIGQCHPGTAHELARLLVMDGQWSAARDYADNYELRCGSDPVVRNWGNAPRPHSRLDLR